MTDLSIQSLRQKSIDFVNLLGNEHDTTSDKIVNLLAKDFAVQHGESAPSSGGRDAFLTNLGQRLKLAKGHAKVEIKHTIAEVFDETGGGQCWVYSRKFTPRGISDSLDMITFDQEGKIVLCQDLHSPRKEAYSSLFKWLLGYLFGMQTQTYHQHTS